MISSPEKSPIMGGIINKDGDTEFCPRCGSLLRFVEEIIKQEGYDLKEIPAITRGLGKLLEHAKNKEQNS